MVYVVTEPCIKCKYTNCAAVCPVDENEVNMVMKPVWTVEMIKEGVEFFAVPSPPRG